MNSLIKKRTNSPNNHCKSNHNNQNCPNYFGNSLFFHSFDFKNKIFLAKVIL